ncbi:DUF485 domain-containing protein [Streptomyces sp. NPDC059828]|uniref:DUF485 domain-containing protein n=1 Tax=Streptomyces sp. NPDC059828 TaxID=3346965 RepID=UPI00365EBCFE
MSYERYFDDPVDFAYADFAYPGNQPAAPPGGSFAYAAEDPAPTPHRELPGLRASYRRLRRVATFTALGYFVLFLFLSAYAPGLMSGDVSGGLTTGLLLGLLQLPVTLAAIAAYERIARQRVDPLAASIRNQAEQTAQLAGGARA